MSAANAVTIHQHRAKTLAHELVKFGLIGGGGQSMARHECGSALLLEDRGKVLATGLVAAHGDRSKALAHKSVKFGLIVAGGQAMARDKFGSASLLEDRSKAGTGTSVVTIHEHWAK